MESADQVILVLQVVLTIGPVAVYFLGLGLASSQAHPCLVSERSDFVLLASAFVPIIVWPVVALVKAGSFSLALVLLAAVGLLFILLLPRREEGAVIYNISSSECRRAIERACRRLGWTVEDVAATRDESECIVPEAGLAVGFQSLPWLRNVTVRCRVLGPDADRDARRTLLKTLSEELCRESLLPSATGAGLVVIGATLLGLPMWYFFHHMDAIVDVVRRILLA
jgi:hypothetical protein